VPQSWFNLRLTDQPVTGQSWFDLVITDQPVGGGGTTRRSPGFVQPIFPEIVRDEIPVRVAVTRALVTTSDARAVTAKTVHQDALLTASRCRPVDAVMHGTAELSRMVVLLREDDEFLLGMF
jgi:hypothetical protein